MRSNHRLIFFSVIIFIVALFAMWPSLGNVGVAIALINLGASSTLFDDVLVKLPLVASSTVAVALLIMFIRFIVKLRNSGVNPRRET